MRSGPLKLGRYTNEQHKSCVLGEVENVNYFDLMTLNQIQTWMEFRSLQMMMLLKEIVTINKKYFVF